MNKKLNDSLRLIVLILDSEVRIYRISKNLGGLFSEEASL